MSGAKASIFCGLVLARLIVTAPTTANAALAVKLAVAEKHMIFFL
jgi:hypothetical protein